MRAGGHDIPTSVVRRRFERGWRNLEGIYLDLADEWVVYDTSNSVPKILDISERRLDSGHTNNRSKTLPVDLEAEGDFAAIYRAAKVAHRRAAERGDKIAIWRDGKVDWIDPIVDSSLSY